AAREGLQSSPNIMCREAATLGPLRAPSRAALAPTGAASACRSVSEQQTKAASVFADRIFKHGR
ncbi:hypothetical protein, partial [Pantoea sp. Tr-811]|uniref:hypothetical protein n=1 Tax=Pantoea sp. Tr-811 TaxID=2608361 RepID=UPI0019628FBF